MIDSVTEHSDKPAWSPEALRDPHGVADKAKRVRETFGRIARRYDRVNRLLSMGGDRAWRRAAVRGVGSCEGKRVLDVACGTGVMTAMFAAAGAAEVVGLDFCPEMLDVARRERAEPGIVWIEGDALATPLPDGSVDIVSVGFGLRNFADTRAGLAEMRRVLRPGGKVVVLEFALPESPLIGTVARGFIRRVVPRIGRMFSGDRGGGYDYLASSIDTYYTFAQLVHMMTEVGFEDARLVRTFSCGAVGLITAVRS